MHIETSNFVLWLGNRKRKHFSLFYFFLIFFFLFLLRERNTSSQIEKILSEQLSKWENFEKQVNINTTHNNIQFCYGVTALKSNIADLTNRNLCGSTIFFG